VRFGGLNTKLRHFSPILQCFRFDRVQTEWRFRRNNGEAPPIRGPYSPGPAIAAGATADRRYELYYAGRAMFGKRLTTIVSAVDVFLFRSS
jgi:hypothetical protein